VEASVLQHVALSGFPAVRLGLANVSNTLKRLQRIEEALAALHAKQKRDIFLHEAESPEDALCRA